MTANEMFGELGYARTALASDLIRYENDDDIWVEFCSLDKTVSAFAQSNGFKHLPLSMMILNAIKKQCQELGWLDG